MKTIELTQGLSAIIDAHRYEAAIKFKWCAQRIGNTYYAVTNAGAYRMYLHHFVNGCPLNNCKTDHKDGNGINCVDSNLRVVTNRQNIAKQCLSKGKLPGATYNKGKYQTYVRINNKLEYKGTFSTQEEAFIEYRNAITEIGEELLPEHEELYLKILDSIYNTK